MWEWVGTIGLAGLCWAWLVVLTVLLQGRYARLATAARSAPAQTEPRREAPGAVDPEA